MFDKDDNFRTSSAVKRAFLGILWLWVAIPAFLMLRAISPVSVTWTSWTSFTIERSRSSHRERASKRVADQLTPLMRLSVSLGRLTHDVLDLTVFTLRDQVIAAVWLGAFVTSRFNFNFYIVAPAAADPIKRGTAQIVLSSLEFSLLISGTLFQMTMNRRNSTFAGRFSSAMLLWTFTSLLWVVRLSSSVVGKRNPTYGWTAMECFALIVSLGYAYQAVVLPAVEQEVLDEEEE